VRSSGLGCCNNPEMESNDPLAPGDATWLRATPEQQGLQRYLRTLRERLWLIVLAVVLTTAAAVAYVLTAEKVYEAEAGILISPISNDTPEILGSLGLLRESAEPIRLLETAARLVTTPEVAEVAAQQIDEPPEDSQDLLDDIVAEPIAESNFVSIIAQGPSPEEAADLANAFGAAVIAQRTATLRRAIDAKLEQLGGEDASPALEAEIGALERLRAGPVPDMQLQTKALPPDDPVAPRPLASILGGILAGLVIGIGGAFASQVLDPRFRREEQLSARFNLPTLARIPRERSGGKGPLSPEELSGDAIESFRTLRATLATARPDEGGAPAVLVTSASAGEGKTSTALNLAATLALGGRKVILIEADLRLPTIGKTLDVQSEKGLISTLIEESSLEEALTTTEAFGPNLKLLLAEHSGPWLPELFSLPAARRMIEDARGLADYIVIDSPPLTEVVDALPLARAVDVILMVVRLGMSPLGRIDRLAELLAENRLKPSGFVVVGGKPSKQTYYHDYRREMELRRDPSGAAQG